MDATPRKKPDIIAILLLIRVKSTVKLVFHYPLDLGQKAGDDDTILFGHRFEVLKGLLAAQPWSHGKKLEVTFDNISFLSYPSFAREDGSWSEVSSGHRLGGIQTAKAIPIDSHASQQSKVQEHDFAHAPNSFNSQLSSPGASTSLESVSTKGSDTDVQGMDMFQLLFAVGKQNQSQDLYEHIVQPLSVAIQHLQEHNHWVERECRALLSAKARARAQKHHQTPGVDSILSTSELAWALKEVYESVQTKTVATIRLCGTHMTLLFPTSNGSEDQYLDTPDSHVAHLAVLLLEEKSRLLHELDHRPGSAALAFFITHIVPTKPLSKVAVKLSLPVNAVIFLAKHLVKWRKARLIPPLHARNTYAIDPEAPLEKLEQLSVEYAKRFPALLSLENMLQIIGSPEPIVYGTCFPSRVHRETYMDILAWLVGRKLVTRLRTLGWLCIVSLSRQGDASSVEFHDGDRERSVSKDGVDDPFVVLNATELDTAQRHFVQRLTHALEEKDLNDVLHKTMRHLDGEHALEDIAAHEGLKRASVEDCLAALNELGALKSIQCL